MEMLVLQHIFSGVRNTSMVERLERNEIPAGWDLWNFQGTLQKIYIEYIFHKDEVESYRMFREALLFAILPDF